MTTQLIHTSVESEFDFSDADTHVHRQESVRDLTSLTEGEFQSVKEFDIEIDYHPGRIPMEGDLYLQLTDAKSDPLRLGYSDDAATVEIIGWGLTVPSEDRADLPLYIGRRFLELYSASINGTLDEQSEACLDVASRQVNYRAYLASRVLPRYREATLVRRQSALFLQFIDATNVKLDIALSPSLRLLRDGDRFGAWFTTTPKGEIKAIQNPVLLSSGEMIFEQADQLTHRKVLEFPDSLLGLLPKSTPNDG